MAGGHQRPPQLSGTIGADSKMVAVPDNPAQITRAGWRTILARSFQQFKEDEITDRAAALTYYGVLALFPGLLVLVSVLGLLGHDTTRKVVDNVGQLAPGSVKTFLDSAIQQTEGRMGGAGAAAIIGLLVAIWSASGYIGAFMRATNTIYGVDEGRPIWKTTPIRLGVTVAIMIILVVTSFMVVVTGSIATQVGKALGIGQGAVLAWDIAKWPVLLILVSIMFTLLYWACPNVKQPGFQWITPGGAIAVVIWLAASAVFGLYVSFAGSYNKTYGTLATVIIFLVWLWITNIAILLGAEFNAETEHQRAIQAGLPEDVEPFVELRDTRKLDPEQKQRVAAAQAQQANTTNEPTDHPTK